MSQPPVRARLLPQVGVIRLNLRTAPWAAIALAVLGPLTPALAQHRLSLGPQSAMSVHHFENLGVELGVDLKTLGVSSVYMSPIGIGVVGAAERHWLGIGCPGIVSECPTTAWTVWAGLVGEVSFRAVSVSLSGEVGRTTWRGESELDRRATVRLGFPAGSPLMFNVGAGWVDLTPLGGEHFVTIGLAWVRRLGDG